MSINFRLFGKHPVKHPVEKIQQECERVKAVNWLKMALAHNTKCFNVCPQSKFDVEFPYFRKPIEIGCFSQDSERKVVLTRQQMKFYVVPTNPDNVAFDLRIGYRDFIRKDETRPDLLDDLLKWILKTPSVFTVQSNTNDTGTDLENKRYIYVGI